MDAQGPDARRDPGHTVGVHRVIARLNVGGPTLHVTHLSLGLGSPFETTLFAGRAARHEGDLAGTVDSAGVNLAELPGLGPGEGWWGALRATAALYRRFKRDRPLIVHTHTAKAGALGRIAAALAGVPVRIHTFHGHVLGGDYFSGTRTAAYVWIERCLARLTDRIVVLSEAQREEMAVDLGVAPPEAFCVIPLGLELAPFLEANYPAERRAARDDLGLPEDAFLIASVGRLAPIKRHDRLFRALARRVVEEGLDWHVVVAGGGELEDELRRLADELGVSRRVHWLGWRDDLPHVLSACDVLALTSADEGTPVAVIEALALGLPVVAADVGGLKEMVAGQAGARLFQPESQAALEVALAEVAAGVGPSSREERETIARRFSVSRLTEDVRRLYRAELKRKGIEGSGPISGVG